MREIPLTRGMVALVDDEDYEEVSRYRWHAHLRGRTWYAKTNLPTGKNSQTSIEMHLLLMRKQANVVQVDHVDGDGLNNRRGNLRQATRSQQCQNRRPLENTASGFKGVHPNGRRWKAAIKHDGRQIHLGTFDTRDDAARAYDAKARELFGEFARVNFITSGIE